MKTPRALLLAAALVGALSLSADYAVTERGIWPDTWPAELDPLRETSSTFEGPLDPLRHYAIPFTQREAFEAAWPHLLKAKSPGAPIFLLRPGKRTEFFGVAPAGVLIQSPPDHVGLVRQPEKPRPGITDPRSRWIYTTYIQLVVDGEVVDLNRIPLPRDTPIVDERF